MTNKILVRKEKEPLLPNGLLNKIFIDKMKIISGNYYFGALYQGMPTMKGSGFFDAQYFKYYTEIPKDKIYSLISIDCAEEDKKESDYSCMEHWIETKIGYYLIDQKRGKWKFPILEQMSISFCNKYKSNKILIETKSNGTALYQNLSKNTTLPVHEIKPNLNKKERVNQIIGNLESGNVYFPQNAEWLFDFITELTDFPNGNHDDQVDTLSQALKYLVFNRRVVRIRTL